MNCGDVLLPNKIVSNYSLHTHNLHVTQWLSCSFVIFILRNMCLGYHHDFPLERIVQCYISKDNRIAKPADCSLTVLVSKYFFLFYYYSIFCFTFDFDLSLYFWGQQLGRVSNWPTASSMALTCLTGEQAHFHLYIRRVCRLVVLTLYRVVGWFLRYELIVNPVSQKNPV